MGKTFYEATEAAQNTEPSTEQAAKFLFLNNS
jgi:hypothetical protein